MPRTGTRGRDGRPRIHNLAEAGDADALTALLVDSAAPVDITDNCGRTPLLLAAGEGHADCVQALLAAGASINHATSNGSTALHAATQ